MSKLSPAVLIAFLVGIAVGALLPRPEPPAPALSDPLPPIAGPRVYVEPGDGHPGGWFRVVPASAHRPVRAVRRELGAVCELYPDGTAVITRGEPDR